MKEIVFLLVFQIGLINIFGQVSFGDASKINDGWKFQKGDIADARLATFDDSKWRQLDLPHDWSIEAQLSPTLASAAGYLPGGIAWYRKSLDIPLSMKNKKVFIYFEGIYRNGEVFINGTSLGMRPNGFISYMLELTTYLKFGEKNIISVKVDHSKSVDSRFYTGSGIDRDVYLIYANPIHIDLWGIYYTTPEITDKKAVVRVQTTIQNTTSQKTKLTVISEVTDDKGGFVSKVSKDIYVSAFKADTLKQDITVNHPHLWSIDNPCLYKISTSIYSGKTLLDKSIGNYGIRTLKFDADKGFSLNGVSLKVKGVCLHHDAGCLGAAVPKEVIERRLLALKALGCNAIRTSHNPQAPVLYDLCDKLGLLVMDEPFDEWEFPKKKWMEGWNVGTPGYEGTFEFFEKWSDIDLRDMVLRDRNHPSIFMWSIGNEVDYPNDPYSHPILDKEGIQQQHTAGYLPDHPNAERIGTIAKHLASIVRKYDRSRPVTGALAGPVMSNETEYPGSLDIVGYNYTERRYAQDHAKYPKRVFFGSENHHSIESWKAVKNNDYIFGQFVWTGIDYLGEAFQWPSRGFTSGLLDLAGFKKGTGFFQESLWKNEPMIYIGTFQRSRNRNGFSYNAQPLWNYTEGDTIRIECYTNCARAQLLLNGENVGPIKDYDGETGVIHWDIPFRPGKLEVVGYNANKIAAGYSIETSNGPYAIKATIDNLTISSNKGLAQIELQIIDEAGKQVYLSDNEITCLIDGPAKLLGLEASNPSDMGDYTDNKQRVYHGRMIAYIQTSGIPGKATVTFKSPWLVATKIEFDIK